MKIKVCIENREKIENLLKEVNGLAKEYTFTSFGEVYNIVCKVENKLSESGIPKKDRKGAFIAARSGGNKKPGSYKYKRKVNYLGIERGGYHWFITSVWLDTAYSDEAGFVDVFLTPDQKKKAIENFLASFFNI